MSEKNENPTKPKETKSKAPKAPKVETPVVEPFLSQEDLDRAPDASAPEKTLEELKAKAPKAKEEKEPLVFAKKLIESEKKHYDAIVKANKETISSLRKQVIETRDLLDVANKELETLKAATK